MNKQEQNRKLYLFLPVVVVPFLTAMFFIFGGGKTEEGNTLALDGGLLNIEVPEEDQGLFSGLKDKLGSYNQAIQDKLVREADERKDPYSKILNSDKAIQEVEEVGKKYLKQPDELSFATSSGDSLFSALNEEEKALEEKLKSLEEHLNKKNSDIPGNTTASSRGYSRSGKGTYAAPEQRINYSNASMSGGQPQISPEIQAQIAAYKQQSQQMQAQESSQFSKMQQMLDKILDIQHPERVKERLKEKSLEENGKFYAVHNSKNYVPVDYLGENKNKMYRERYKDYLKTNQDTVYKVVNKQMVSGFISLTDSEENQFSNSVRAVIHETTTVTDGTIIKLRLLNDIVVQGRTIEANTFIYGECRINRGRININIESLQVASSVVPVDMDVYGHDGMQGIYVNGLAESATARELATNTGTNLDLNLANPTLTGRAINELQRGVKQVIRKQTQIPKVTLKANHKILLINSGLI